MWVEAVALFRCKGERIQYAWAVRVDTGEVDAFKKLFFLSGVVTDILFVDFDFHVTFSLQDNDRIAGSVYGRLFSGFVFLCCNTHEREEHHTC